MNYVVNLCFGITFVADARNASVFKAGYILDITTLRHHFYKAQSKTLSNQSYCPKLANPKRYNTAIIAYKSFSIFLFEVSIFFSAETRPSFSLVKVVTFIQPCRLQGNNISSFPSSKKPCRCWHRHPPWGTRGGQPRSASQSRRGPSGPPRC